MIFTEINQLRYFIDVSDSQHITKSAERLHVAQPALTKSIHRLESELGVPLFAPRGRNIVLTEYGRFLRERLLPIMSALDSLPNELAAMAGRENETLHLNVTAASGVVTDAIIAYKRTHEHINFQLMQNAEGRLYDIGVETAPKHTPSERDDMIETVFSEKIFLAVPSTHRLAVYDEISLSEAADEGFITLMGSRPIRRIFDGFCARAGFTPKIIFESDTPAAVKNMIASNIGVGFWPEFTWGRPEGDGVKLLTLREPSCSRDIIISLSPHKADPSRAEEFYHFLVNFCRFSPKCNA